MTAAEPTAAEPGQPSDESPWPWWAWLLTLLSYCVLGYFFKSVFLNWIVGPLYPLVVMYLIPEAVRAVLGRRTPEPLP